MWRGVSIGVAIGIALGGCVGVPARETPPPETGDFAGLPSGVEQWMQLCAKGYRDPVSMRFCAEEQPPEVPSLQSLQLLLGFDFDVRKALMTTTGHSTGVGLRTVTPLNPRVIVMTPPNFDGSPTPDFVVLTFSRGEPLVELVARDPIAKTLRFFVLRFHPVCEEAAGGCNHADLLTPTIESGWTRYTLYDDETVKNTTVDCLACHQSDGPSSPKILRMQERTDPWTHFFGRNPPLRYLQMHAGETYAGYPADPNAVLAPSFNVISDPAYLEVLLESNGFEKQPNEFVSAKIRDELVSGRSPTWEALYDNAVAGRVIPPPFYGDDQTDPVKADAMIQAYKNVMSGTLARDQLPDIRETLLDAALPAMSIRPKLGLDGRGILVHLCTKCHNSRLDQTQSRARFNVETLDALPREEKDLAIGRLMLDDTNPAKMPPPRFHVLSNAERDLVIEELSR